MKKSKKLMLGTIAAMGALAIGAGAVSTFAWFSAAQASATKVGSSPTGTVATATDTLAGTYYLKGVWEAGSTDANAVTTVASGNVTLSLTDSQGDCWLALVHGDANGDGVKDDGETWTYTASAANASNKKYGRAKLSFHAYSDAGCQTEINDAEALKAIDGTYTFYITSTQSRLRFSTTSGAATYGVAYGTDITVTVTIASGVITDNLDELYYSFGGGVASNVDLSEGASIAASEVDSSAPSGTIECALTAH